MNEIRTMPAVELRVADKDGKPVIEGYAVLWDSPSKEIRSDVGVFREQFKRGAFTKTLATDDVKVFWQHSPLHVFGRMKAGTAEVMEDDKGLFYRATPPDTQWARDAMESIRRGDVDQNSFKFAVPNVMAGQQWTRNADGTRMRSVVEARLVEVGPQTEPAYTDTTVAVRSLADVVEAEVPESVETVNANTLRAKIKLAMR